MRLAKFVRSPGGKEEGRLRESLSFLSTAMSDSSGNLSANRGREGDSLAPECEE